MVGAGRGSRLGGEGEDGGGAEGFAGVQGGGGELWLVGGVGEVLSFEAEAGVLEVGPAGLAGELAVEEVAGVELNAGLGGFDAEGATAPRVVGFGGEVQRAWRPVEDEVVVVAAGEEELRVGGGDVGADCGGAAEVEWRAGYGGELAGGDELGVTGV